MKEKIERVLQRYSPPLSEANISEITETIMVMVAAEQKRMLSLVRAKLKKKGSKRQG